jgi:hypothetical protein
VKEVIWLELQAWFAARDLNAQDDWLIRLVFSPTTGNI